MKHYLQLFFLSICVIFLTQKPISAQSTLDCLVCHSTEYNWWLGSRHANTQNDVAEELAGEWAGLPPDSVINGHEAENCIACHGATAIVANSGMNVVQSLEYFFSLTNGLITNTTQALHSDEWPHNACVACHDVPSDHPASNTIVSIFNSPTAGYNLVSNSSLLCGQCHGTLRYPDTDHRRLDAWQISTHGHGGQDDVAEELSGEFAGSTPEQVAEEENCIACHAPTTVMNNTVTEAQALDDFFTTTDGVFSATTEPQNNSGFPDVACVACHNPHQPEEISYFNSSTKSYEVMSSSQELCGQCHGDLRFPDTDHLSYNIEEGSGGIDVADSQTMPGIKCVDCHMYSIEEEGTDASMFGGHSWEVIIEEGDGSSSASCTNCHSSMTASAAMDSIVTWQDEFELLASLAKEKITIADSILNNSTDSVKIKLLEDAVSNLSYAESDESGGVHNHLYVKDLLQDAINKSDQLIAGVENLNLLSKGFVLHQNYPNPFSNTTEIAYTLPKATNVGIRIFNVNGQLIRVLLNNKYENAGIHTINFDARNLNSGIYYCKAIFGNTEENIKMVLLNY